MCIYCCGSRMNFIAMSLRGNLANTHTFRSRPAEPARHNKVDTYCPLVTRQSGGIKSLTPVSRDKPSGNPFLFPFFCAAAAVQRPAASLCLSGTSVSRRSFAFLTEVCINKVRQQFATPTAPHREVRTWSEQRTPSAKDNSQPRAGGD